MSEREEAAIIAVAIALENAGSNWRLKHAAAVTGYSISYVRNSDCPKHLEKGNGPKGKPRVVLVPSEVRAWKASQLVRIQEAA